jgi:hypothetical protein
MGDRAHGASLVGSATVLACSLQIVTVAALVKKAAEYSSIEGIIIDCLSVLHKTHRVMTILNKKRKFR